jgi:hypothetical protein
MAVNSIRGVVESAIQRASQATGTDFSFLLGTARRESGGNPTARAQTSSAAGLFQFVEQTWLSTLKKHGPKYGYARYADLISQGSDGRYHVAGAEARKAVMDLRLDPHAASLMAGELSSDHAAYLRGRVGRSPTSGELYIAHFLGPQGSARLIEAARSNPGMAAAGLFPEAASANRPIFYKGGRPATVAEVYANLTRSPEPAAPSGPETTPRAETGFLQYASARSADVQRAQQAELVDLLLNDRSGSSASGSMFSSELLKTLAQARQAGLR